MKHFSCAILAAMLSFGQTTVDVELKAAIHKEQVQGDLKGAIEAYRKIIARNSGNRAVVAQAMLRMAECHEKLGEGEARKIYEQIVKGYGDQASVAAQARARLGASATKGLQIRRVDPFKPGCLRPADGARWEGCIVAGTLVLTEIATGKEFRMPGPAPRESFTPGRSSPDNSIYAYVARKDGGASLFVVRPGNGDPRDLGKAGEFLAWSPDSRHILATTAAQPTPTEQVKLVLIAVADGSRRVLGGQLKSGTTMEARFSPDGKYIVYGDTAWFTAGNLRILTVDSGADEVLVSGNNPKVVGWHKDGWLLCTAKPAGPRDLFRMRMSAGKAAGPAETIYRDLDVRMIWMSNEGSVFYMLSGNASDVFRATLNPAGTGFSDGPAVVSKQYADGTRFGTYSRDGNWIAYDTAWRGVAKIVAQNLNTGETRERVSPFSRIQTMQWFSDGAALLVHGSTRENEPPAFHRFDVATGELKTVFQGKAVGGDLATNPTFSADGRYIYFKSWTESAAGQKAEPYLARLEMASGQISKALPSQLLGPPRHFAFSPDRQQIVYGFHTDGGDAYAVAPVNGGESRIVFRCSGEEWTRGYSAVSFTGDGKGVVLHKVVKHIATPEAPNGDEDELWHVPLNGGSATKIHNTGGWTLTVAGRNGTREIAWQAARVRPPEFWVMENVASPISSIKR
ncbi:MAG: PD40 domain-containing protein [Acidobacteria bacterium]|nr:PD40 domain-containing protein [Acidobacteriota bacterium]